MNSRFLVTGLPRTRSAWIAALLTAHGAPCLHEPAVAYGRRVSLKEIFDDGYRGIVYPCAGLEYGAELPAAFMGHPVVVVDRDPHESRAELEKWSSMTFDDAKWREAVAANETVIRGFDARRVRYADLDKFEIVDRMVRYLTGDSLDPRIFKLFDSLDVQQHKGKALQQLSALEAPCHSL